MLIQLSQEKQKNTLDSDHFPVMERQAGLHGAAAPCLGSGALPQLPFPRAAGGAE
jgi:hypothetical protein